MRKVIAAINMTLDGVCDHTVGIVDENIHYHYSDLVNNAGVMLYGRTTYQLMQFWQTLLKNPSDQKSMNDFAFSINKLEKIVFSNTLKDTGWDTAKIASQPLEEMVLELKQQSGQDILIGSRSLIIQLQTPTKLTTLGRFKLTTPGRSKLTMLGRAKLTT